MRSFSRQIVVESRIGDIESRLALNLNEITACEHRVVFEVARVEGDDDSLSRGKQSDWIVYQCSIILKVCQRYTDCTRQLQVLRIEYRSILGKIVAKETIP